MQKIKDYFIRILRQTEKYTKTDMLYLAQGSFWLGIGQIVSSGSAFLISIAFANLLPPETYGVYKYILSILGLLAITTLNGMDPSITQAVSRGFDGTVLPAVKTRMKWGLLGSILSLLIAYYYFTQDNITLAISLSIVAIFLPLYESIDMYGSFLVGKKLFNIHTSFNSIRKIIGLIAMIATLFLTDNLYIIMTVFFLSALLPTTVLFLKTYRKYKENDAVDKDALSYGKHLSFINVITAILGQLDKILVFQYIGAVDLAIYALATAPTDQIKGLLKNVNLLAFPKFANQTKEETSKTIWGKVWVLLLVSIIIVGIYILLAPYFFNIFFPKYLDSIPYSQLLSISLIPVIISGFLYTSFESQKSKSELYKFNIYTNIFNLILLFPLIYFWGLLGAVLSRTLTRFFGMILSFILMKNYRE